MYKRQVIYEGLKLNEEYLKFMQKCQIGLCTQNIDAAFNTTSFPSKILSYMSNGLEVVGVNIAAIKNSKVGQYIQFYNVPDEKEIANAILNINLNNKTNNVDVVKELDKEFKEDLKDMLVKYCLLYTSPFMIIIAIIIKCSSKGPVLFKQERVGKNKNCLLYTSRCV